MNDGSDLGLRPATEAQEATSWQVEPDPEENILPADQQVGLAVDVLWDAPRRAYLLTGLVAVNRGNDAEAIWKQQDKLAQADLLAALAAQARQAGRSLATVRGAPGVAFDLTADIRAELCSEALRALTELLRPDPGPWQLPECGHCREAMAQSLIRLAIRMGADRQGIPRKMFSDLCLQGAGLALVG